MNTHGLSMLVNPGNERDYYIWDEPNDLEMSLAVQQEYDESRVNTISTFR